jgi:hypothetical protein
LFDTLRCLIRGEIGLMKSYYILPSLFLMSLAACGREVEEAGAPAQAMQSAHPEPASIPNTLRGPDEEVTAEEIQQRREAWVRNDDGGGAQVASAEAAKRE